MKVTRVSPLTGITNTIDVPCTREQYDAWANGHDHIQNIMPDVDAGLREFLMTGITPDEWDKYIKDGGEE